MLTLVREFMTHEPLTIAADADIATAVRTMSAGGFRHLPVTRGGAILGMLSLRDIPHTSNVLTEDEKDMPALALG
jgi:CBS domain-containing protein